MDIKKHLAATALLFLTATSPLQSGADSNNCTGHFLNVLTEICWDCLFPVTVAGASLDLSGTSGTSWDYDSGAGNGLAGLCICKGTLTAGVVTSFWEPMYLMDVSPTPGCMVNLGIQVPMPINANQYGTVSNSLGETGRSMSGFGHVNLYLNPILTVAGFLYSSPCLDSRSFDIPWISVMDPSWADDQLTLITQPWSFAFGDMTSALATGPDAVAANVSYGIKELFWVAGAWGSIFPTNGTVSAYKTPEQLSHLLVTRILAKNHALGLMQSTAGQDALEACGVFGIPEFVMDKRQYKISRSLPYLDNMCMPIGRDTLLQESGTAGVDNKDYGYVIFRKKDCCAAFP
jgi:conjugal transfer pilus assembly protein TraU